jgi:hypothetical protein
MSFQNLIMMIKSIPDYETSAEPKTEVQKMSLMDFAKENKLTV